MRSLSVAFTIFLFLVAGALATRLKRAGLSPAAQPPPSRTLAPNTTSDAQRPHFSDVHTTFPE